MQILCIHSLQRLTLAVLNTSDTDRNIRECISLLSLISSLVSRVTGGHNTIQQCQTWLKTVAVEHSIGMRDNSVQLIFTQLVS